MNDLIIRFFIGGVVVSLFAALGDIFRPRSFAGLFGAAPSIALATIGLTVLHDGKLYAAIEARSMILGAISFFIYSVAVSWVLGRYRPSSLAASIAILPIWLGVSIGLWTLVARWI
jgi:hypothetical protein